MDPERASEPIGDGDEKSSPADEVEGGAELIPLEPEDGQAPEAREGLIAPKRTEPPAPRTEERKREPVGREGEDKPLVREGLGGPKAALIVGAALLIGAMVAAAMRIANLQGATLSDSTLAVFYVLFSVLLHTLTGFAALLIGAKIAGRAFGRAELGVARMLVAVGAFALVANLNVPIPGRIDEYVLAAIAYTLVVWGANRLSRLELGVVVVAHALILIALALGLWLHGVYASSVAKLGPPVTNETQVEPEAAP